MSLSDLNRATFECVFADNLPYTDRAGMIISETSLNRLMEAVRDEEAERAAARAEGRPSPDEELTPVRGVWRNQSLSRIDRVRAHRAEFGSELKAAVEAVDQEAEHQRLAALSTPPPELYECEVSDVLDAIAEHRDDPAEEWSISLSAGHWRCLAAHLRGFNPSPEAGREEEGAARKTLSADLVASVLPGNTSLTNFTDFRCSHDDLERVVEAAYKRGWSDREDDIIERAERLSPPAPEPDLFAENANKSEPGYEAGPVAWAMIQRDGSVLSVQAKPYQGFAKMMAVDYGYTVAALYASPVPVAISLEEIARLIHEHVFETSPDELIHQPWQKSWEEPTRPRWDQWTELADAILQRLSNQQGEKFTPTHRHVKRGTTYQLLGWGRAQCSESGLLDNEHVAIYRGEDGSLWARRLAEFNDGRFEALSNQQKEG